MSKLLIVESPAKVKTIKKFLDDTYDVVGSKGHLINLQKKNLSIDINNDFQTTYEFIPGKESVIKDIKNKVKKAKTVYLATDNDAEGEAMANHFLHIFSIPNYKRITFNEITKEAITEALKNPRNLDGNLVNSQETRRVLDRLVGYKLSPVIWKSFDSSTPLSTGRVQAATLNLIIEKENQIKRFKSTPYWIVIGDFSLFDEMKLYEKNDTINEFDSFARVEKFITKLTDNFYVTEAKVKEVRDYPDLPFITSTLQYTASSKLRLGLNRVMSVAQDLYEKGFITYIRTDSYNISETFKKKVKSYIESEFPEYYTEPRASRKKVKGAQNAHECIRVIKPELKSLPDKYSRDHKRLYELIWKRSIAHFMVPAIYDELTAEIVHDKFTKGEYFKASVKKLKFDGYLNVYKVKPEKYNFDVYLKSKDKKINCKTIRSHNIWKSPPKRYNDSAIIKELEDNGIGRPSTYSSILNKIYDKFYIEKTDLAGQTYTTENVVYNFRTAKIVKDKSTIGEERSVIMPTILGEKVNNFVDKNFTYISDKNFTSAMEDELDMIEDGKKTKKQVLTSFWNIFGKDVENFKVTKKEDIPDIERTVNGKKVLIKITRYGYAIVYNKKFYDLDHFMKAQKKRVNELTEKDLAFVMSIPKVVGKRS